MLTNFIITLVKVIVLLIFCPTWVPIMVVGERRVSALIQNRLGPNRANMAGLKLFGLAHVIADMVKFFMKEDFTPANANKIYHSIAPLFIMLPAFLAFMVIPFGDVMRFGERTITLQAANLNVGILYLLAIISFGVYGPVISGWASNSKYALLGGLRAAAQMISYEVAMGLVIISVIMTYGSVQLNEIVRAQGQLFSLFGLIEIPRWGVINQPLAFFLFLAVAYAEVNRTPFDLPEAESELVAGYHTEYSGMKFGIFMMSEYMGMLTMSALIVTFFFGGWQIPWFPTQSLLQNSSTLLRVVLVVAGIGGIVAAALMTYLNRGKRFYYGVKVDTVPVKVKILFQYLVALGSAVVAIWFILSGLHLLPGDSFPGILVVDGALPAWGSQLIVTITQVSAFLAKVSFFMFMYLWVRWTIPRFRYDQLMKLGWKIILPLSLLNIFVTALLIVI